MSTRVRVIFDGKGYGTYSGWGNIERCLDDLAGASGVRWSVELQAINVKPERVIAKLKYLRTSRRAAEGGFSGKLYVIREPRVKANRSRFVEFMRSRGVYGKLGGQLKGKMPKPPRLVNWKKYAIKAPIRIPAREAAEPGGGYVRMPVEALDWNLMDPRQGVPQPVAQEGLDNAQMRADFYRLINNIAPQPMQGGENFWGDDWLKPVPQVRYAAEPAGPQEEDFF